MLQTETVAHSIGKLLNFACPDEPDSLLLGSPSLSASFGRAYYTNIVKSFRTRMDKLVKTLQASLLRTLTLSLLVDLKLFKTRRSHLDPEKVRIVAIRGSEWVPA